MPMGRGERPGLEVFAPVPCKKAARPVSTIKRSHVGAHVRLRPHSSVLVRAKSDLLQLFVLDEGGFFVLHGCPPVVSEPG